MEHFEAFREIIRQEDDEKVRITFMALIEAWQDLSHDIKRIADALEELVEQNEARERTKEG